MKMTTPMEKGNALENAVKAIEHAILQSVSGLEKDTFLIESKKIINVDGVHNEIDVSVEIDHGKDYKSLYIFECKNWEKSVGKNEIIIFSEKIDVLQAQKGFVVAKSFTRDAEAQALKDKRIKLLCATEYSVENLPVPFDFHFVFREKEHGDLIVEEKGIDNKRKGTKLNLDIGKVECLMNGESFNFDLYIKEWIKNCAEKRLNTFPSATKPEGSYDLDVYDERIFNKGELTIDGRIMEKLKLNVTFITHVKRPGFVSHYEVHTRGRVLSLAPVQLGTGGEIQVSFFGNSSEA